MSIEERIQHLFIERGLTFGLAESCTGGTIASKITSISGASEYFLGGIVSYSNLVKEKLLKVSAESINHYGVVSEVVSKEMAQGALHVLGCDLALSVTGLAGPSGATPGLPLGSVFISLADSTKSECFAYQFTGSRHEVIHKATQKAFELLEEYFDDRPDS